MFFYFVLWLGCSQLLTKATCLCGIELRSETYLIGDGYFLNEDIFLDLQLTLFSMSCNTNQLTYKIRYSSDYLDTKISNLFLRKPPYGND